MAQKPDGKAARTDRVTFTRPAAERIAKVVRKVEQGRRGCSPLTFGSQTAPAAGSSMRLGKTLSSWSKGTLGTVQIYEAGTAPNETASSPSEYLEAVNKFTGVAANKWVIIAKGGNGKWYLISAEC